MRTGLSRRVVLRGLFQGATVAVAVPYLDCFLNSSGTALLCRFDSGPGFGGLASPQADGIPRRSVVTTISCLSSRQLRRKKAR